MSKTFLFFKNSVWVSINLNDKTGLFQTIQFSVMTQFSSIWPRDRTLSDAASPDLSGSENDGNEKVISIHQSSGISGAS